MHSKGYGMVLNHLFVTPTVETLKHLTDMMAATPIHGLDLSNLRVTLFISPDEIEAEPTKVYSATPGSLVLQHDAEVDGTSLVMPLASDSMYMANRQLQEGGTEPAFFGGWYLPYMKLVRALPPMRRNIRAWINSISTTLYTYQEPLYFTNEQVVAEEFTAIPDYYYMVDTMRAAGIETKNML
ncbi:hypothetical protein [Achromobacter phage Motura]|uniref:Uncharacterized protein n=1 Tax=Achromobacter phage Motura TaxID=2591403 RepID=A0A514CSM4_9CAUD|nr:hypothetical protein H1O15_gp327 [Achromobacter phage Motura]QDH83479.1 hypothetical protein [Achromobacter phage Motura]